MKSDNNDVKAGQIKKISSASLGASAIKSTPSLFVECFVLLGLIPFLLFIAELEVILLGDVCFLPSINGLL